MRSVGEFTREGTEMTIRIPVRLVLSILYTIAVLAVAFGISYGVFEWRDDDTGATLESLGERIDVLDSDVGKLDGRVGSLNTRVAGLSTTTGGSTESAQCHGVLWDLTIFEGQIRAGEIAGSAFDQKVEELTDAFSAYC